SAGARRSAAGGGVCGPGVGVYELRPALRRAHVLAVLFPAVAVAGEVAVDDDDLGDARLDLDKAHVDAARHRLAGRDGAVGRDLPGDDDVAGAEEAQHLAPDDLAAVSVALEG